MLAKVCADARMQTGAVAYTVVVCRLAEQGGVLKAE
jgi:hypothetical protein